MCDEPAYAEYRPRASLRTFVHCVWTFSAPLDDVTQPIAPDGRPELIVHYREPYIEHNAGREIAQPQVLFAGQLTEPLRLKAQGETALLGVRFHPHSARAFLGFDASVATNRRLDLAAVHGERVMTLRSRVYERGNWKPCIEAAEDYVEDVLRGSQLDADVDGAVGAIFAGASIEIPAELSERQWQRRFKFEVGVSPRMLQAIVRFRRVFDAIEHPGSSGWLDAALAAGYFDQPQMARDFRRFLGCTAREWAAQKRGLATALAGG
jgi:hypothetical protein